MFKIVPCEKNRIGSFTEKTPIKAGLCLKYLIIRLLSFIDMWQLHKFPWLMGGGTWISIKTYLMNNSVFFNHTQCWQRPPYHSSNQRFFSWGVIKIKFLIMWKTISGGWEALRRLRGSIHSHQDDISNNEDNLLQRWELILQCRHSTVKLRWKLEI